MGATFIDAGGVLLNPDGSQISEELSRFGIRASIEDLHAAHYHGMASLDRAAADHTEELRVAYWQGFGSALGQTADAKVLSQALADAWTRPRLWCHVPSGAIEGLSRLASLDRPVSIVSNADGTVEFELGRLEVCQVGRGPGVPVADIVDSGAVGVAKPDPAIFQIALERLNARGYGVRAERSVHIGDSVHLDVLGARRAGVTALHLDPLGLCRGAGHRDIRSLAEAAELLSGAAGSLTK